MKPSWYMVGSLPAKGRKNLRDNGIRPPDGGKDRGRASNKGARIVHRAVRLNPEPICVESRERLHQAPRVPGRTWAARMASASGFARRFPKLNTPFVRLRARPEAPGNSPVRCSPLSSIKTDGFAATYLERVKKPNSPAWSTSRTTLLARHPPDPSRTEMIHAISSMPNLVTKAHLRRPEAAAQITLTQTLCKVVLMPEKE